MLSALLGDCANVKNVGSGEIQAIRRGVDPETGEHSGGIGTVLAVLERVTAGATRIGASTGVEIVECARAHRTGT
jgi:deoxyribose-phosphate aldolase